MQVHITSSLEKVISMHSDISKKDHEHSNHFPVVMLLYNPYNREKEYKGLNAAVTYTDYHYPTNKGTSTSKPSLGTTPTLRNTTLTYRVL